MRLVRQVAFAVSLVLVAAAAGWAQDAVIGGKVADPSGAALPGVDVTLASTALMGGRAAVSDEQGDYRFSLLPPGTYTVIRAARVRHRRPRRRQLTAGFTSTLNVAMDVALGRRDGHRGRRFADHRRHERRRRHDFYRGTDDVLPTGHDVFSVLAITPGVQVTAPDVGGSRAGLRAQFRVFGSTSQWNVIEGAIMASLQYEDPDVYQEVQVAGASKGADAPVGGSFNNFIVKSGGNTMRGLLFYDREPLDASELESLRDLSRRASPTPARLPAISPCTAT